MGERIKHFLLFIGLFLKEYFSMCVFVVASNVKLNKDNTFDTVSIKVDKEGKRKAALLAASLNYLPGIIAINKTESNGSIELLINYLENKNVKDNYIIDISDKFQTSINNIFN